MKPLLARIVALVAVAVLVSPSAALAKTEIQWWHALTAVLGERVNEIAAKFNASQNDYEVKAVYKGSYPDTLNAAIAAYRAKQPPHIVQVYEVGTQTMLSSGAVYPVYQLVKDHGVTIDWNDVIGPVKSYYSSGGNLYSMAFNSSTPVLFYNKELFKKAGLPDKPPATWDEVEAAAKKLVASGAKCGFSAAWPSWTLMENMHALHDQPFADHANGFDGLATTLKINGAFGVTMMELLQRGAKEGWFTYNGRLNRAESNMGNGECGVFLSSSAYIGNLTRASRGVQGRRAVLQVSGVHRQPGMVGGRDGLPADLEQRGEGDGSLRALRQASRAAHRDQADAVGQDHAEQPGHPARQLSLRPRRHRRADGEHLQRQEDGEAGPRRRGGEVDRHPEGVRRPV